MFALAFVSLVRLSAPTSLSSKPLVGVYQVVKLDRGKPVNESQEPPGRKQVLTLTADGKWSMHDMLVGMKGTWRVSGKRVVFVAIEGPTGKFPQPQKLVLEPRPDRRRLVIVSPKELAGAMEFRWKAAAQ